MLTQPAKPPLSEIVNISKEHKANDFDCGKLPLNEWIKGKALKSHSSGNCRVSVICRSNIIVGYYAVSASSIAHANTSSKISRNAPDPVPAFLLGRLAVDLSERGQKLGSSLLRHALTGMAGVSEKMGARVILVHAMDDDAASFYQKYDFEPSPINPLLLWLRICDLRKTLNLPPL